MGAASIQLANFLGGRAIASAGSEEKLAFCRQLGAAEVFNYKELPAFSRQIKEWGGANMILDPVAASYLAENIASLKPDGRLVIIGLMGGIKGEINLGHVLMKRLSLIGSTLRSQPLAVKAGLARALEEQVLLTIQPGQLKVTVDSSFPLAQVAEAQEYVGRNQNLGKVVLTLFPVMPMQ
ncbi:zinc-binding dehydrogenase [Paludibacterium denitrificans]|uniref:zinc-binding dehydrogenase n=1 Tax=Paludibacterium denitrificans TaxID=2675226 RepID=UPI001E3BBFA9|nr:zinc-binding dehydrogenase [Paludibacterium denitrificans]